MESKIVGKRVADLMQKRKVSIEKMCDILNIQKEELLRKLNGEEKFCVSEIIEITKIFNLSINACSSIFFNSNCEQENDDKVKK